jgi:hypothetical protein
MPVKIARSAPRPSFWLPELLARIFTPVRESSGESWLSYIILIVLALLGIALRTRQYLFNRSLWVDEASLALNVIQRDTYHLLTEPLAFLQSATPGFLIFARAMVVSVGPYDWAIRIVPLAAGILSVFLVYILAQRELRSLAAKATFVGLVALSPILIFYSSEFKQYSSDAFFTLCILVAVSYRSSRWGTWLLAGTGSIALFCSLPAFFVAVAAGVLVLYERARSSCWRQFIIVSLAWSIGALLHGLYVWQASVDREYMVAFWRAAKGFAPFPPISVQELLWYPRVLENLIYQTFKVARPAYPGFPLHAEPWLWFLTLILISSGIAGVLSRRAICGVAIGAITLTLIASVLEVYPFSSRLLIFLTPLVLLLIAAGVDELHRLNLVGPVAAGALALLLVAMVVPKADQIARQPVSVSDMRGALKKIRGSFRNGDAIAVAGGNGTTYQYYSPTLGRDIPFFETDDARSLTETVEQHGFRRVWLVTLGPLWGSYEEEQRMRNANDLIREVERSAAIVFDWNAPGTRLVLFDFSRFDRH